MKIHQRSTRTRTREPEIAGLVQLPGKRALILVRPDLFTNLKGVSLIPLADGRAFLALDAAKGVADLEVAVLDRLDAPGDRAPGACGPAHMRQLLKHWRQDGMLFEARAIVVAYRPGSTERGRPLAPIDRVARSL